MADQDLEGEIAVSPMVRIYYWHNRMNDMRAGKSSTYGCHPLIISFAVERSQ